MSYDVWNDATLAAVGEVGYSCYDWDLFAVYHGTDTGLFYWISGSGCSCSDLYEYVHSRDDFESGIAQQAHDALDEWFAEKDREVTPSDVADLHYNIASV